MDLYTPCAANNKNGKACCNEAKKGLILCPVHHRVFLNGNKQLVLQTWAYSEYVNSKSISAFDYQAPRFVQEPKDVVKNRKRVRDFLDSTDHSLDLPEMNKKQRHRLYSRYRPGKRVRYEVIETKGDNKKLRVTKAN